MSFRNKSIIITGGAGFIGSHLADYIYKKEPEKLIIVDNFFLGKHRNIDKLIKKNNVVLYYQDAAHYEKMLNIFEIENVDIVFNLAVIPLLTSHELPKITCEDNVNITLTLLELLRKEYYKTLIHCSSSEAYGSAIKVPMNENHSLNPTTPYAASKAASDLLVTSYEKTFGIDISIARPFNNYGPRQNEKSYAGVIPITFNRIISNQKPIIYGDGLQTRDYIYVEDTVKGLVEIYNHKSTRGKILNLATGKEIQILEVIKKIMKEMKYNGEILFKKQRKADVRRHMADISLAKKLIDFKPKTSFEDGIKKTINWYRKTNFKKGY